MVPENGALCNIFISNHIDKKFSQSLTNDCRYSAGDVREPFSLQSTAKPLTYALALNELGQNVVHHYVGQEPSGEVFNMIKLDQNSKSHGSERCC